MEKHVWDELKKVVQKKKELAEQELNNNPTVLKLIEKEVLDDVLEDMQAIVNSGENYNRWIIVLENRLKMRIETVKKIKCGLEIDKEENVELFIHFYREMLRVVSAFRVIEMKKERGEE